MSYASVEVSVDRNTRSVQSSTRVARVPVLVTVKDTSRRLPLSGSTGTATKFVIVKSASAYTTSIGLDTRKLLSLLPSSQGVSFRSRTHVGNALRPHRFNTGSPKRVSGTLVNTCAYQVPLLPGGVATTKLSLNDSPGPSWSSKTCTF